MPIVPNITRTGGREQAAREYRAAQRRADELGVTREQMALAEARWALSHVPATLEVMRALGIIESASPLAGTHEARAMWEALHAGRKARGECLCGHGWLHEDCPQHGAEAWAASCSDCYGLGVIEGELCPTCKGRRR